MITAFRMLFIAAAAMVVLVPSANAGQSFSITPPPIAAPTFEEGKTDGKVRFTYVSLSGNGMDFSGGGIDGIGRKAFSSSFAGDVQAGLFVLGGDISMPPAGKTSTTFLNMMFSANGEFQVYKGDVFSTLLFAGPNLNFLIGSMDYTYPCGPTTTCDDTMTMTTSLFGLQAGVQFGIKAGDFHIDPFAMIMSQQGNSTVDTSFGSQSITIDPYTTTSFGLDITYTPWNMSFSAILQEAAKQNEDEEGITTHIYQLSWHF
jgi:hypothetical protein